MAQILVYTYMQNFLPHIENLNIYVWAGIYALQFAGSEARKKEVSDIDLYYLEYAKEKNDVGYLYSILSGYRIFGDPQGTLKAAVYSLLRGLDENAPGLLVKSIIKGDELLAYYGYLFEEFYKNKPINERVQAVSEKLEQEKGKNDILKLNIGNPQSRYFYSYNHEGVMLHMPENIGAFTAVKYPPLQTYQLGSQEKQRIEDLNKQIEDRKKDREVRRKERDGFKKRSRCFRKPELLLRITM